MATIESKEVLTTVDVAKLFRVHTKTIVRWADEGKLPHYKTLGGHRRFLLTDLAEFVDMMRTDHVDRHP